MSNSETLNRKRVGRCGLVVNFHWDNRPLSLYIPRFGTKIIYFLLTLFVQLLSIMNIDDTVLERMYITLKRLYNSNRVEY
jgi:hypothetical protein